MGEQQDKPKDAQEAQDLRESAEAIGVEDTEEKDPEQIVEEVRHEQADSEASPSGWKAEREEDGQDGAQR